MDISAITDTKELKALAYDLLRQREQIQSDLDKVNLRIRQLEQDQVQNNVTAKEHVRGGRKKSD